MPARAAAIVCIALAFGSGAISYLAAHTKSATIDEPLHLGAAAAQTWLGDFRVNPEDPPLWKYWAMLPHRRGELALDAQSPLWNSLIDDTDRSSVWAARQLYQTPGNNDDDEFIARSRAIITLLG